MAQTFWKHRNDSQTWHKFYRTLVTPCWNVCSGTGHNPRLFWSTARELPQVKDVLQFTKHEPYRRQAWAQFWRCFKAWVTTTDDAAITAWSLQLRLSCAARTCRDAGCYWLRKVLLNALGAIDCCANFGSTYLHCFCANTDLCCHHTSDVTRSHDAKMFGCVSTWNQRCKDCNALWSHLQWSWHLDVAWTECRVAILIIDVAILSRSKSLQWTMTL